jgi:uncharacterized protein (TIGR02646 family)
MIKIDRGTEPVPPSLAGAGNPTDKQREKARRYYEADPTPTTAYPFDKYKEPDVVDTLERLFHKKCAYCESSYAAVSKMDVEHYRPKGGVNECPTHKGYWWLALDWNNLLPSCIDCNRCRGQKRAMLHQNGLVSVTTEPENTGKENSFPVDGGYFAMQSTDDYGLEIPLIINPCEIDPSEHLSWHLRDIAIPIIFAKNNNGVVDVKGESTVRILGLNRWGLVNERAEILQQLSVIVADIYDLIEDAVEMDKGDKRDRKILKINEKIEYLSSFGKPQKKYSSMSRFFIDSKLTGIYDGLQELKKNLHL